MGGVQKIVWICKTLFQGKKREMQRRETKGGKERLKKNVIGLYLARQDLSCSLFSLYKICLIAMFKNKNNQKSFILPTMDKMSKVVIVGERS
jgi:hypothetical protein